MELMRNPKAFGNHGARWVPGTRFEAYVPSKSLVPSELDCILGSDEGTCMSVNFLYAPWNHHERDGMALKGGPFFGTPNFTKEARMARHQ